MFHWISHLHVFGWVVFVSWTMQSLVKEPFEKCFRILWRMWNNFNIFIISECRHTIKFNKNTFKKWSIVTKVYFFLHFRITKEIFYWMIECFVQRASKWEFNKIYWIYGIADLVVVEPMCKLKNGFIKTKDYHNHYVNLKEVFSL